MIVSGEKALVRDAIEVGKLPTPLSPASAWLIPLENEAGSSLEVGSLERWSGRPAGLDRVRVIAGIAEEVPDRLIAQLEKT